MSFIYFSCLTSLAGVSNSMLNKCDESRHPCLVLDLEKNAFIFFPLNIMLSVGMSYMAFIILRYVSSILTLLTVLILNGCWILSNVFLHLSIRLCDFIFPFVYVAYFCLKTSYLKCIVDLLTLN